MEEPLSTMCTAISTSLTPSPTNGPKGPTPQPIAQKWPVLLLAISFSPGEVSIPRLFSSLFFFSWMCRVIVISLFYC